MRMRKLVWEKGGKAGTRDVGSYEGVNNVGD